MTTYELIEECKLYSTIINNDLYSSIEEEDVMPHYINSELGSIRIKIVEIVNFIIKELYKEFDNSNKIVIFKLVLEHLMSLETILFITDVNDIDKFEVIEVMDIVSYNIILDLINIKIGTMSNAANSDILSELLKQELVSTVISVHYVDFCKRLYLLNSELISDDDFVEVGPLVYKVIYNLELPEQRCVLSLCYGIAKGGGVEY